jgi:hypothetical protein
MRFESLQDFKFKYGETLILLSDYKGLVHGTKCVYIMYVGESRLCKVRMEDNTYLHIPDERLQTIKEYRNKIIQSLE